jgi:hypothetical protein
MYRLLANYKEQSLVFEVPKEKGFLGSADENDLVLRVKGVSRRHAELRRCPGGVEVIDLDSTNGILVEGLKVERTILTPGLRVQVGEAWVELQEVSTPESGHRKTDKRGTPQADSRSRSATASAHGTRPSARPYLDAMQLAFHMDLMGTGTPGKRDELLARLRSALGTTLLLSCEWRRREKLLAVREMNGEIWSEEERTRLNILLGEPRGWSPDEVRIKRIGVFLLAGRSNLFLVAKFIDEPSAREEWRKICLRLFAERLLGKPPAIEDAKIAALSHTLALTGNNKSETARILKISRQTVYNFLKSRS